MWKMAVICCCSDITLSYILPAKWTNKIGIKNTSVYASVKMRL